MHTIIQRQGQQDGFTLLEVLVALLVLSIGLLGLAGLQTIGMRSNMMATMRTLSTQYTYNISDRMRSNPDGLTTTNQFYVIGVDDPTPVITSADNCYILECTPAQTANFDLWQWRNEMGKLPGIKSQITQGTAGGITVHTITVHWNETRDPNVAGLTCPPASETDLRCFQLRI